MMSPCTRAYGMRRQVHECEEQILPDAGGYRSERSVCHEVIKIKTRLAFTCPCRLPPHHSPTSPPRP